jgi:threonine synthase
MEKYRKYIQHLDSDLSIYINKTPLIKAYRLGDYFHINNLYLKFEGCLPFSHTFKDRGAVTVISYLIANNKKEIAFASCGNMGSAIALVAARKSIKTYAIISGEASLANKWAIYKSGAKVIQYTGRFDEIDNIISIFSSEHPDFPCVNTNLMDIYAMGLKSLYYEICDDLCRIHNEINIIVPTADGTLLKSLFEAYKDYYSVVPDFKVHFILAQPSGCAPVVKAFVNKTSIQEWSKTVTKVLSLSVNHPKLNGEAALAAVYESRGVAIQVDELDAINIENLTLEKEGICIDDVGCISIGALNTLTNITSLNNIPTVCLLTGNGLKTLDKNRLKTTENKHTASDVINFLNAEINNG